MNNISEPQDNRDQSDDNYRDDTYLSDPRNWKDINADMNGSKPDSEPDINEYDQVSAILKDTHEVPGNHGHMILVVTVNGSELPLGQYLAGDLFKKMNQGKLTKEQGMQLYDEYIGILRSYRGARIAKSMGASLLTGAERRVGWDAKELAAGEHLQD